MASQCAKQIVLADWAQVLGVGGFEKLTVALNVATDVKALEYACEALALLTIGTRISLIRLQAAVGLMSLSADMSDHTVHA